MQNTEIANRPYTKLVAWQEAHRLCVWVYKLTKKYPSDERFRLTSQICRAASSVPMNVAEGNARRFKKDKARFFEIALGSLDELHYQCLLSEELDYISKEEMDIANKLIQKVSILITKLRSAFLAS